MARNVYAWPPVDAVGTMWTVTQPINRSQSFFTGADVSSSAERKRYMATVEVPAIGDLAGNMNAGYCEVLKDLLEGGKNLVRLNSMPVNWYFDDDSSNNIAAPSVVTWEETTGGTSVTWDETTGGTDVIWLTSARLQGVKSTANGFHTVRVEGLPANTLIVRPGEYVRGYASDGLDGDGSFAKVLRPAYSDASGGCTIYLTSELADAFHVELNSKKSAVFMVEGELPISVQPVDGNWSYVWNFREVFSDEVGGFTEIDPWT